MSVSSLCVILHTVSQRSRPSQPFTVAELHNVVSQADQLGLRDETRVIFESPASWNERVFTLSVVGFDSDATESPRDTPVPGARVRRDARTVIRQGCTGPLFHYRRWLWFWRHETATLRLGDVRTLHAGICDAEIPADWYEISALPVRGTLGHVHWLEARPRRNTESGAASSSTAAGA